MAENLGSIRYDVEVNTAGTLKADTVVGKTTDSMVNNFKKVDNAAKNLDTQVTKASAGVKRAMNANLGQAGIQVQQFVGQLQGGQSAMVALAQQSADLGIVLGAPMVGVIVSLAAVLAGTLLPSLMGSKDELDNIEKSVERVKAVMTIGAHGVANYTDEMRQLSSISKEVAQIKLNTALAEQRKVLENTGKAAKQAYKDAMPWFNWSFNNSETSTLFGGIVSDDDIKRLGSGSSLITRARTGVDQLVSSMEQIKKGNTEKGIEGIVSSMTLLSNSAAANSEAGQKLIEDMTKLVQSYKEGTINIEALQKAVDKGTESMKGNASALQDYLSAIHISSEEMNGNAREAEKLRLEKQGLEKQEVLTALASWDYYQSLVAQKKATEESIKQDKEKAESLKKINDELDAYFDKESSDSTKKDEREKGKASNFAQNIVDKARPESEVFADELEKLTELRLRGLLSQQLYDEAIVASVTNRADKVNKANEKNLDSQALFNQSQSQLLGSLGGLFGAYADNMEVQDKKSFEKKKKFQTAQALINTAMAVSNALAAAPPPINFALAAASGAMGAMQVAAIQNQQYSGGREFGGPVSAGSMYRVGEKGKPEFYKDNLGNLSMIPGENGEVIPANKMGGNSGGMTVQVNNYTPYQVFVTQDQATNIAKVEIGNEASKLQKGRGNMYNAMKSGGNYKNDAKR
ncbi:hypothetical protein [Pseudoalteromonas phage XCL1123]|nr:hypothetical protein [Pseudoalteromonas phage XCL1123]